MNVPRSATAGLLNAGGIARQEIEVSDLAVSLVPGRLFALGGMIRLDRRVSWAPPGVRGYQPINCYLLREGNKAILVDSGVPIHRDRVLQGLRSLLSPEVKLSVFLTRAERECVGNLGSISAEYPIEAVFTGGVTNPFDAFDSVTSVDAAVANVGPESGAKQTRSSTLPPSPDHRLDLVAPTFHQLIGIERKPPSSSLTFESGRRVEVIVPTFRLLATYWVYDSGTGTLFTSDGFGHTARPTGAYRPLLSLSEDRSTPATVRAYTKAKFWWMEGAATQNIAESLGNLFSQREVVRVAPTHGCVLEGHQLVQKHWTLLQRMLDPDRREKGGD